MRSDETETIFEPTAVGQTLTENFSYSDDRFGQDRCCSTAPVVTKARRFFHHPTSGDRND
jgi:hypothetical protein